MRSFFKYIKSLTMPLILKKDPFVFEGKSLTFTLFCTCYFKKKNDRLLFKSLISLIRTESIRYVILFSIHSRIRYYIILKFLF